MNPIIKDITDVLTEMKIPVAENVFQKVPQKPYVTWCNIQSVAEGSDRIALYWRKTYAVYVHYPQQRNEKQALPIEKPIEEILRCLGTFKRVLDISYDSQEIITAYIFEVTENFETEE